MDSYMYPNGVYAATSLAELSYTSVDFFSAQSN